MGVLTTGNTFSTGDQVTASKLNDAVNSATLQAAAVDNTSTQLSSGAIIVKDLGITQDKIASDAVGTNQLANDVVISTSGSITTTSGFTGSVTGNVTGNLTGNVTGGTGAFTTISASGDVDFNSNLDVDGTTNLDVVDIDGAVDMASNLTIDGELTVKGGGSGSIVVNDEDSSLCPTMTFLRNGGGTTTNDFIKFENSGGEAAAINASGGAYFSESVGIGTAAPAKKLHIASDANGQTTADIPGIRIENTDTTALDTNVSGEIEFFSKDASEADKISGFIKNVAEDAGTKYALTFGAKTTGANATEAMRIDADGNVGIGVSSPSQNLDVYGASQISYGGVNTYQYFQSTSNYVGRDTTGAFNIGVAGSQPILFKVADAEKMRLSSSGDVGIGTSPSNTLHVKNTTSSGAYIQYDGQSNNEFGLKIESNVSGGDFEGDFANNGSLLDLFANSSATTGGDILACRTQSATPVMLVRGNGRVGIGTALPSAPLEVASTTGGVIMPRMTTTQKNAISSPTNGEMVYDTTDNKFYGYANGSWVAFH